MADLQTSPAAELTPSDRTCPSGCGPLVTFTFRGVSLEECLHCAGIWFDAREFQKLEKMPSGALYFLDQQVKPVAEETNAAVPAKSARRCPSCDALMLPFAMRVGIPVTLDRCDLCSGLWADDQELVALCEALGYQPSAMDELSAETRGTLAIVSFEAMTTQKAHRASVFHHICSHFVRRPGLAQA